MKIIKIHTPDIFINTNKIEFLMEVKFLLNFLEDTQVR
jgi:hypothetical protein